MQSAINMHLSQISHGKLATYDLEHVGEHMMLITDEVNNVVVGYTPSMIHLFFLNAAGQMLLTGVWYDWYPDYIWTGNAAIGPVDSFLDVTERGFKIDGEAMFLTLEAEDQDLSAVTQIIFETYGCSNKSDYQSPMNPDPAEADNPMDAIPGWALNTDYAHDDETSV